MTIYTVKRRLIRQDGKAEDPKTLGECAHSNREDAEKALAADFERAAGEAEEKIDFVEKPDSAGAKIKYASGAAAIWWIDTLMFDDGKRG